jgi:hypothetical protein
MKPALQRLAKQAPQPSDQLLQDYAFAFADGTFSKKDIAAGDIPAETMAVIQKELLGDNVPTSNPSDPAFGIGYSLIAWSDNYYRNYRLYEVSAGGDDPDPWAYEALFTAMQLVVKSFQSAG